MLRFSLTGNIATCMCFRDCVSLAPELWNTRYPLYVHMYICTCRSYTSGHQSAQRSIRNLPWLPASKAGCVCQPISKEAGEHFMWVAFQDFAHMCTRGSCLCRLAFVDAVFQERCSMRMMARARSGASCCLPASSPGFQVCKAHLHLVS